MNEYTLSGCGTRVELRREGITNGSVLEFINVSVRFVYINSNIVWLDFIKQNIFKYEKENGVYICTYYSICV